MKIRTACIGGILSALLLSGCQSSPAAPVPSSSPAPASESAEPTAEPAVEAQVSVYPYTFSDSMGNAFTLEQASEKTAVLFSSYAEIWKLCGGDIAVTVGDSVKRGFAEEGTVLVNDGPGLKIDQEVLVGEQPDLIIGTADLKAQVETAEFMNEQGVPAVLLREENFEDYLTILKLFADLNENPDAYETYGLKVQKDMEQQLAELEQKEFSYLFIRAGSAFSSTKAKTAEDHFACVMLDDIGGRNIAEAAGNLAEELSLESILEQDPEYIIICPQGDEEASRAYMESLMAEPGWSSLRALQDEHVFFVEKELYNYKPNQRWAEAYRTLIDLIYE